jgi:hypothetical protein
MHTHLPRLRRVIKHPLLAGRPLACDYYGELRALR